MLERLIGVGSRRKFVLLLGNTGAVLSYVSRGRVQRSWYTSGLDGAARREFTAALHAQPRTPVVVLVDLLEQSYRKEAIPPVSVLDRPKVLQRRLNIVYPTHDLKAALSLGEKTGRRGDLAYMFVALPLSSELESWVAFLHSISNPVSSLGLLPLESTGLASALAHAVMEPGGEAPEWVLLMTQQRTGGFRQVVVRRDKLALTRITPAPTVVGDASAMARSIEQEVKATLSYLTRLGYSARQGLDAIIVGSEEVRAALELSRSMPVRTLHALTPEEAGRLVGVTGVAQPEGAYGELLHSAWFAQKRRASLQLVAEVLGRRQLQLVTARKWGVAALSSSAALLTLYCGYAGWTILDLSHEASLSEQRVAQLRQRLENNRRELESSPENPRRMNVTLEMHERLLAQTVDPAGTLRVVADALAPSVRVAALEWQLREPSAEARRGAQTGPGTPDMALHMVIDLGAVGGVERALEETEAFAARLRQRLDGWRITVVRPPLDILPSQTFSASVDRERPALAPKDLTAEIEISRPPS